MFRSRGEHEQMLVVLTIALILAATVVLAALELWVFWSLGEREDRRRGAWRHPSSAHPAAPGRHG